MIMDSVWDAEITELGMLAPPDDSFYPEGLDSRYDIYIVDLKTINSAFEAVYGFTQPEEPVGDQQYTSFVVMDNDYSEISIYADRPLDAIRVTAAHEFFHSSQFAYDAFETEPPGLGNPQERRHWLEMSAVWMEEQVYDDINDFYGYVPGFMNYADISLRTSAVDLSPGAFYQYAAGIWPMFLSETYGTDIVRLIWEDCADQIGPNVFTDGFNDVITSQSGGQDDFSTALSQFYVWAFFTGTRSIDGFGFEESSNFAMIPDRDFRDSVYIQQFRSYPITYRPDLFSYLYYPDYLGANYLVFKPQLLDSTLTLVFNGSNSQEYTWTGPIDFEWRVRMAKVNFELGERVVDLDPVVYGDEDTLVARDLGFYSDIVVIAMPYAPTAHSRIYTDVPYAFEVLEASSTVNNVQVFDPAPNPLVLSDSPNSIIRVEQDAFEPIVMYVFTLSGERIFEKTSLSTESIDWNGKNQNGETVASGLYLVNVRVGDVSEVFKIAVIE